MAICSRSASIEMKNNVTDKTELMCQRSYLVRQLHSRGTREYIKVRSTRFMIRHLYARGHLTLQKILLSKSQIEKEETISRREGQA